MDEHPGARPRHIAFRGEPVPTVLWAFQLTALKGDPLNALVRECLLEERSAERSYTYNAGAGGGYTLKWSFNNVRHGAAPAAS